MQEGSLPDSAPTDFSHSAIGDAIPHIVDGEPQQRVHTPVVAVEEINEPGALKDMRDLDALVLGQPFRHRFVDRARNPTRKSSPACRRISSKTIKPKQQRFSSDPPWPSVRLLVAGDRNWPIRCALPRDSLRQAHPPCSAGRPVHRLDHTGDIVVVHFLREASVERLAHRRGSDRRQPAGVRFTAPAEMRNLAHDRSAVLVNPLGEFLQVRDHVIIADI